MSDFKVDDYGKDEAHGPGLFARKFSLPAS